MDTLHGQGACHVTVEGKMLLHKQLCAGQHAAGAVADVGMLQSGICAAAYCCMHLFRMH